MTGRDLVDWLTERSPAERPREPSEVLRTCARLGHLPAQVPEAVIEAMLASCGLVIIDEGPAVTEPEPHTWLFRHDAPPLNDRGDGAFLEIRRGADGDVVLDLMNLGVSTATASMTGEDASDVLAAIGRVWRLALLTPVLAELSDDVKAQIDSAGQRDTSEGYAASYGGLEITEHYFSYAAAFAAFLAACHAVSSGSRPAEAVASVELLVAALRPGPDGIASALAPAWAQAELALSHR